MTVSRPTAVRALALALLASLAAALGAGAAPAQASAGAWWLVNSSAAPTTLKPGSKVIIYAMATDIGYEGISGATEPVVFSDKVPPGLKIIVESGEAGIYKSLSKEFETIFPPCSESERVFSCSLKGAIRPAESVRIRIEAEVEESLAPGTVLTNEMTVKGGQTPKGEEPPANSIKKEMPVSNEPVQFGTERFELRPENRDGTIDTQAGSHPFQLTTVFNYNKTLEHHTTFGQAAELPFLPALPKDIHFVLPPGLAGAIAKVPRCSGADFVAVINGKANECKPDTAVGFANATLDEPLTIGPFTQEVPIFNLTPTPGEPVRFGFIAHTVPVVLTSHVRSGSDYAVEVSVHLLPESIEILNTEATFWGVPQAPEHDNARSWPCLGGGYLGEEPCKELKASEPRALLVMPTSCEGTPTASVNAVAWSGQEFDATDQLFSAPLKGAFEGCDKLPFAPSVEVETDSHDAATPTGMTVKVKLPQETTVSGKEGELAESAVRGTTLTLPKGIQASGGASDGLLTCTGAQFGFEDEGLAEPIHALTEKGPWIRALTENNHFNQEAIKCPEAAKIGTVSVKSPLIEEELEGSVYLASADTNPFGSPLVLYIYAEGPESKVQVKLAGEVEINQQTGQLTSYVENTPPLAFSELTLHLFNGPRASQSTPEACGESEVASASFEGWSGKTVQATSKPLSITHGPGGSACPAPGTQPFAPSFEEGSESPQAGAFTPLIVSVTRPDGNQGLKTLTIHDPPGTAGLLASVTPCPTAVATAAEPACPESSVIGESTAYAGLGSDHAKIPGKLYLTGPYKGAPFGVLDLSDAEEVGPFNLGKIPVMSTITVNETTGAATVTSDPLPERVKGVPAQLHSVRIAINRPHFTFNPTNCNPLAVNATLTGYGPNGSEGSESVTYPFHAANCAALPFEPTLEASIESNVSRSTGTGLKITVRSSPGQANIAKSKIEFPTTIPSRLTTLQKSCRDTVFNVNPANCSPESIVGTGVAHTPVLKSPLTGPIYLVSHGNAAFPDAEFVLQGEGIKLVLDGKTDIEKGITISSFESVPDAPVETFEVDLPRSTKSAFSGYGDLCTENPVMPTVFTGQNGKIVESVTKVNVTGCAAVLPAKTENELAKNLKICNKLANRSRRAKCVASAHRRFSAVNSCKKLSNKGKRSACEVKARKKNPLKK